MHKNYGECYAREILYRVANGFIYLELGFYISALEHCRKMKFRIQLHLTLIYNLRTLSSLNGFVECRASSFIQWDVIISGTEHNMKLKFSMLTYLTHINTILEYYHASVIIDHMMSMFCI